MAPNLRPMPKKGPYTQGIAVLFGEPVALADLEPLLKDYRISQRIPQGAHWALGGPTLLLDYLPAVNGRVSLDVVSRPWPDAMDEDETVFAAWTMGCFGPFAYPENLSRALQHSYGFAEAAAVVDRHQCFVRIRSSYLFGAQPDSAALPEAYNAVEELQFVTSIALQLLQHPAALCYFNPNGEVLAPLHSMQQILAHYAGRQLPPLDLWCNVRMFAMEEGQVLMDTVGMQQLDLDDLEVVFDSSQFEPEEMARFLRNASLFVSSRGPLIRAGHNLDGPAGKLFQAQQPDQSPVAPPRTTMRFLAQG